MSVLRRAHDHHRDLRTLEAAARAAGLSRTNRDGDAVTRHGSCLRCVVVISATAIDTLRAHRLARTGKHADPRRHHRLGPSMASNQRLKHPEKLLGYRSGTAG